MRNYQRPIFICLFIVAFTGLKAQQTTDNKLDKRIPLKTDIQFGIVAGGQISNEEFVYKSGLIGQLSINTALNSRLSAGLGIAIQALETETIIPVFVDVKAKFKEGESASLLGLNVGGSSGWSTYYRNFADYEYSGGFYFSPYYAFQFPVKENIQFLLAIGYTHQLGWIEYFTEFDEVYEENFAMDFLNIRAGLRF